VGNITRKDAIGSLDKVSGLATVVLVERDSDCPYRVSNEV
jgi:hypothetical protein